MFGLGLFPGVTASAAVSALGDETVSRGPSGMSVAIRVGLGGLELPTLRALLDPTSLLVLGALLTVPVVAISWALARQIPRRAVDLQWGCGGVRDSPRMQYTATSFAEPLVRVFGDTLRPTQQLHVERAKKSRFVVVGASYRQRVGDVIEDQGIDLPPSGSDEWATPRGASERQHPPLSRVFLRRARRPARGGGPMTEVSALTILGGPAAVILQCVVVALAAPVLIGVMRQVRYRMEGRVGPGIWQPTRDLLKLAREEPLVAPGCASKVSCRSP